MSEHEQYDVVIVGAGPAGCTVGCYLKKYQPNLKIIILDRASEISLHGGETLTPNLNAILKELDLWEAINQSDWIIKLGTTYRWGKTNSLWDLDSLPKELCESLQKNKDQESLRNHVSFFIDRTEFDKLLQERCKALGCIIQKDTPVAQINHDNQSITALELKTGETIQAKYYVDASGNVAFFRRFLQLPTFSPFDFSHTFIWDHWHFSKDFLKGTGLRAQILSTPYGWLWQTPITPTRLCIGYACDTEYFNQSNKAPNRFYLHHLQNEPLFNAFLANGTREEHIHTYQPHGFIAEQLVGPNWFLVGDAASEIDPILNAGINLAMISAMQCAHTLISLLTEEQDPKWLKDFCQYFQKRRALQHHRFATFWYAINKQMSGIQPKCQKISIDNHLFLNTQDAITWLSQDGFIQETTEQAGLGGFPLYNVKHLVEKFTDGYLDWEINRNNVFKLDLTNDTEEKMPFYWRGKVKSIPCYRRGNKLLPDVGPYTAMIQILKEECTVERLSKELLAFFKEIRLQQPPKVALLQSFQILEALITEGWVIAKHDPEKPNLIITPPSKSEMIHPHGST